MTFSRFIEHNLDAILSEWQAFADGMHPHKAGSAMALLEHGRDILMAGIRDMESGEPDGDRFARSRRLPDPSETLESAAAMHGAIRKMQGFELPHLVAEFRALRASVLDMWRRSGPPEAASAAVASVSRFNQAIDQAMAEAVGRYTATVMESRDMFLAMLGHDLRSPLWVIDVAAQTLGRQGVPEPVKQQSIQRIGRASKSMGRLISDLLGFTSSRLGGELPMRRGSAFDLRLLAEESLDDMRGSYPERSFAGHLTGDLVLQADRVRMEQALCNLLANAAQHGERNRPVTLTASSEADEVLVEVHNFGAPIPAETLPLIFEPMVQGPPAAPGGRSKTSLGLGLFIVKEIVKGHGGTVTVESSAEAGTLFSVRLPRAAPSLDGN